MKLLTKTTIYYLLIATLVFGFGGIVTYYTVLSISNENINEYFDRKEAEYAKEIATGEMEPRFKKTHGHEKHNGKKHDFFHHHFEESAPHLQLFHYGKRHNIYKFLRPPKRLKATTNDTVLRVDDWQLRVRRKIIVKKVNQEYYKLCIYKSMARTEEGISAVIGTIVYLFVSLLIVMIIANYYLSRRLIQPFNQTLDAIKGFSVTNSTPLRLQRSNILEFEELNALVVEMTSKIQDDYRNLKEFTENASHEIQTPLAIIKSKIELLIQSDLSDEQMLYVQAIYEVSNRLSKINKALLLLAKIENQQFQDTQVIDFGQLLKKHLANFEELIEMKNIFLKTHITQPLMVEMNATLADMLISNLISNAIKHNITGGEIIIRLEPRLLKINNTGKTDGVRGEEMFNRFKKDQNSTNSVGLGLSIVKKICDNYKIEIQHLYQEGVHEFSLEFGA